MKIETGNLRTPIGTLGLHWTRRSLTRVDLEVEENLGPSAVPAWIRDQLEAYFADGQARFDLPLDLRGTAFQHFVWQALRAIPPGTTLSYGDLAARLGTGPRAIGGACRANPCPVVVPCHRVVARRGLGGFSGDTCGRRLDVKRWLLRHEGVTAFRRH